MSNLSGVQFQSKDWNPFVGASNLLDKFAANLSDKDSKSHYSNAMVQQNHTEQTSLSKSTKPTPGNTGAPVPGYLKRGPINPSTTGAPVPGTLKNNTATNPITGAKVPRVPVKSKGAKPTAPGTRPKKK
jgi:hypothetical protein